MCYIRQCKCSTFTYSYRSVVLATLLLFSTLNVAHCEGAWARPPWLQRNSSDGLSPRPGRSHHASLSAASQPLQDPDWLKFCKAAAHHYSRALQEDVSWPTDAPSPSNTNTLCPCAPTPPFSSTPSPSPSPSPPSPPPVAPVPPSPPQLPYTPDYATLVEFLNDRPDLSVFLAAMNVSGLVTLLNSVNLRGTLYIPTDAAFASLQATSSYTQAGLFANPDGLRLLLQYHLQATLTWFKVDFRPGWNFFVMSSTRRLSMFKARGRLTWQDESLRFGRVVEVDWTVARAVVYVCDTVMLPSSLAPVYRTWADALQGMPNLSLLRQFIIASQIPFPPLTTTFTFLAPDNSVFQSLLDLTNTTIAQFVTLPGVLPGFLGHMLGGVQRTASLVNGQVLFTLNGQINLIVRKDPFTPVVFLYQGTGITAAITQADILASSGVMHIVNRYFWMPRSPPPSPPSNPPPPQQPMQPPPLWPPPYAPPSPSPPLPPSPSPPLPPSPSPPLPPSPSPPLPPSPSPPLPPSPSPNAPPSPSPNTAPSPQSAPYPPPYTTPSTEAAPDATSVSQTSQSPNTTPQPPPSAALQPDHP